MSKKKKKHTGRTVLTLLLALMLIGIALAAGLYFGIKNYNNAFDSSDSKLRVVEIPSGSSAYGIGNILEKNGIIRDARVFRFKSKFNNLSYEAGTYSLSPAMTMNEIVDKLQHGFNPEVSFTVAEGLTLKEVGQKLELQGLFKAEDFYAALEKDYDFSFLPETGYEAAGMNARANRLEGYLYPETYRVPEGADPEYVINTMLKYFETKMGDLLNQVPSGYTLHQMITLASMIEKECGVDSDRKVISGVFWNRLRLPMRLQSDVTIIYALGEFQRYSKSPYNTYEKDGLPAGPICSPSMKSLDAAMHPDSHNYYYFVLKGNDDGSCNFAVTYDEHLYNVYLWENRIPN